MSKQLAITVLSVIAVPIGAVTSAIALALLIALFAMIAPFLTAYLAFIAAANVINKLFDWFEKPSLKFEGFNGFTLDVIKRLIPCALLTIPFFPVAAAFVAVGTAIITPLLFIALTFVLPYTAAQYIVSFFKFREVEDSEGLTGSNNNGITYVNNNRYVDEAGTNPPLQGSGTDHYQPPYLHFFGPKIREQLKRETARLSSNLGFGSSEYE